MSELHFLIQDAAEVATLLQDNDDFLLCPHINPDPDSIGSAVGLYLALKKLGKQVHIYLPEDTPPYMDYLLQHADVRSEQPEDPNIKMIFLDLGTPKQLHPLVRLINPWLDIDHHLGPVTFAKYAYIDQTAPATAQMVAHIIQAMGCPLDETLAMCLYSGLVFDTRNLTTGATTPDTILLAASMVDQGADPEYVNCMLNQQKPLSLMQLMGEVFLNLHTALEDTLVWAVINQEMLRRYQLDETECDPIITELLTIATAEVIVLFKEAKDGNVKISWRSKGRVDVNKVARSFGGGGHRFACGTRLSQPLASAIQNVIATTTQEMHQEMVVA